MSNKATLFVVGLVIFGLAGVLYASAPVPPIAHPTGPAPQSHFKPYLALLSWHYYSCESSEMEYYIYHTYNISIHKDKWQILDTTCSTYYPVMIEKTNEFFAVRAMNKITGEMSDWATVKVNNPQ